MSRELTYEDFFHLALLIGLNGSYCLLIFQTIDLIFQVKKCPCLNYILTKNLSISMYSHIFYFSLEVLTVF